MWEVVSMEIRLKISEEPITTGDLCKNCVYAILRGNPKHGPGSYGRFCGNESNLVEVEDFTEGIRTFYAELCSEHNSSGTCGDYSET